jgi:hypothetical protein
MGLTPEQRIKEQRYRRAATEAPQRDAARRAQREAAKAGERAVAERARVAEAAEKARERTARARLKEFTADLESRHGGVRAAARALGYYDSPATVAGWRRGTRPDAKSLPRIGNAGYSLDWLFGYDVPRDRGARELVGELRPAVRQYVAKALARRGVPARQVAAYLPTDLLGWLVDRAAELVDACATERRKQARALTEAQVLRVFRSLEEALAEEDAVEAQEEYALWGERGDVGAPVVPD